MSVLAKVLFLIFFILLSASNIWRNYPKKSQDLFRKLYLTTKQGCTTTVAASVLDFDKEIDTATNNIIYLQPYALPRRLSSPPFPLFEMLGPYQGYRLTEPRLPTSDGGKQAAGSLFAVCEELTGC